MVTLKDALLAVQVDLLSLSRKDRKTSLILTKPLSLVSSAIGSFCLTDNAKPPLLAKRACEAILDCSRTDDAELAESLRGINFSLSSIVARELSR